MSGPIPPLPSDFKVYTTVIYDGLVKPIIETLALVPQYVAAPVVNIILMGVTFSILWQGLELIRGAGGANPFLDVIAKSLRPMLVLMFAATASAYNENVRTFLQNDLLSFFLNAFNDAINYRTPPRESEEMRIMRLIWEAMGLPPPRDLM